MPQENKLYADSVKHIELAFRNETLCGNIYVIMAQPLKNNAAAFCLMVFGSDNKFVGEDVTRRWRYINQCAADMEIDIEGYSTDGDTRCLKAMKINSCLPLIGPSIYSPHFQVSIYRYIKYIEKKNIVGNRT